MVNEDKKVGKRCKDYLESRLDDIEICNENRPSNLIDRVEKNDFSGLIFEHKYDGFDSSKFYEMIKDKNNYLNFILSVDKERKTGSVELTYYSEFRNREELKEDLREGYGLIDALLDYDKKGSEKDDKMLDLEQTVQLLYDKYVKYIFDKTNDGSKDKKEIIEDNMSKVVIHRRIEKLKELDLIDLDQNSHEDTKESYKSNLDNCRISCRDGIISAEFELDKDIKRIYKCKSTP